MAKKKTGRPSIGKGASVRAETSIDAYTDALIVKVSTKCKWSRAATIREALLIGLRKLE